MMKHKIYAVGAAGAIALSLAACGTGSGKRHGSVRKRQRTAADTGSMPTVKMMVGGIDKQIYLPYQLAESSATTRSTASRWSSPPSSTAASVPRRPWPPARSTWPVRGTSTPSTSSPRARTSSTSCSSPAPRASASCAAPTANVHSGADLKGKTVGVTDLGSGTDELTQFIAAKAGLTKKDYHTLAVGAGATAIAAIQRGSADCVMTTQPTVGALESKNLAVSAIDLATADGHQGGAWRHPAAAGLLAQADWVKSHEDAAQKVVNALVDTMHWISTHSAQDIADKLPQSFVQNSTITKDQYVKALKQDKGQFLPDGLMPAGGPKTIFDEEKTIGVDTSKVNIAGTFNQKYAQAALKLEGYTATTTPAGDDG